MKNERVKKCDPDDEYPEWNEIDEMSSPKDESISSESLVKEDDEEEENQKRIEAEKELKKTKTISPKHEPIIESKKPAQLDMNIIAGTESNNLEVKNENIALKTPNDADSKSPMPQSPFSRPDKKNYVFEVIQDFQMDVLYDYSKKKTKDSTN